MAEFGQQILSGLGGFDIPIRKFDKGTYRTPLDGEADQLQSLFQNPWNDAVAGGVGQETLQYLADNVQGGTTDFQKLGMAMKLSGGSLDQYRDILARSPTGGNDVGRRASADQFFNPLGEAAGEYFSGPQNEFKGLNKFVKMGLPIAALAGGFALAPALFGAAGATGVSAGGATAGVGAAGSGLGASGSFLGSLSSAFAPKAALSGALKGGIGSLLSGGDLGDALKGAALGGATGGFGGSIASGIGLSGAGANAFTGALTGASGGLANGDFKSAGIGALLGGGSGYLSAGGNVPGLGNIQQQMPDGVFGPPQQGTGFLGSLSQGTQGTGGMKLSSLLRPAGAAFSAYQQRGAADDIEEMLLEQQNANQALFAPYNESGAAANRRLSELLSSGELGGQFNPEDLENDPGYQFQLQQGEKALGRSQSARGSLYSGAALKEGQQFSQGLADSTFNDAFRRNLNSQGLTYNMLSGQSGQGLNAAGALSNVNNNVGNIRANATATRSNALNAALSQLLAGDDNIFNSLGFR